MTHMDYSQRAARAEESRETQRDDAPILTSEAARQGETSGHVRLILAVSLTLSLIAFAVLYLGFA